MTPEQLKLADKIEVLREKHRPDWQVEQEPHDYPDGTKHFTHVRYRTDDGMTVEVASYVTPDLGNLLCLLHNNIDQFVAALRTPDARVKEALELAEKADEIHANCDECGGEGAPEECEFCFPSADDARTARRAALSHQPGTVEADARNEPDLRNLRTASQIEAERLARKRAPKSPALDTATVEACAKVAATMPTFARNRSFDNGYNEARKNIANAIRALAAKEGA